MKHRLTTRGFSLMELLVVIAIIGLILSVMFVSFSEARKNNRDKKRVSDLAQIEFALNAYREVYRDFPSYPNGVVIGKGSALDTQLAQFWPDTVKDPLNNSNYEYYYDSSYSCGGELYVVIMARSMEESKNSNFSKVCGGVAQLEEQSSFITAIVPTVYAGSYNQGGYYNEGTYFNEAGYYAEGSYVVAGTDVGSGGGAGGPYIVLLSDPLNSANGPSFGEGSYYSETGYYAQSSYSGSVICTELYRQGRIPYEVYEADTAFGADRHPIVMRGYHRWAKPIIPLMQRSETFSNVMYTVSLPWIQEMAYQKGAVDHGSLLGKFYIAIGVPTSFVIGVVDYVFEATTNVFK